MSNLDLFGDNQQSVVAIEESLSQPLSPAQRKFNATLAKIDKQKLALSEWQKVHEDCQKNLITKFEPVKQQLIDEQIKLLLLLDDRLTGHKFTKAQQQKLSYLILDLSEHLIHETDDDALVALYQRYHPQQETLSPEDQAEMEEAMRSAFQDTFGIELDESTDFDDIDSIAQRIFEHQAQQQQTQKPRKKTAKQLEKEAKERAAAQSAQQSIQEVYRQLVKNLHPDRETDSAERDRKTSLMQEVTVAYEEKNLMKLLELQLQESTASQTIDQLAENKIQTYIPVLEQQWKELNKETKRLEEQYKLMLGIPYHVRLTPKQLTVFFKENLRQLERQLSQTQSERLEMERDMGYLKAWLKYYDPDQGYED